VIFPRKGGEITVLKILSVFLLFLTVISRPALSNDECSCSNAGPIVKKLAPLLGLNHSLNDRFGLLEGRGFVRSPEEIEALRVYAQHQEYLREVCPGLEKRLGQTRVFMRLVGEIGGRSDADSVMRSSMPGGLRDAMAMRMPMDDVLELWNSISKRHGCYFDPPRGPSTPEEGKCYLAVGQEIDEVRKQRFNEAARNMSLSEYEEMYQNIFPDRTDSPPPRVRLALLKLMANDNPESYFSAVREISGELSTEEKISLISDIGSIGGEAL
jgi:hypothetical protein